MVGVRQGAVFCSAAPRRLQPDPLLLLLQLVVDGALLLLLRSPWLLLQ